MPRDGSGNYTLPAGNPVISGTTIDVVWANPTMADVATALTDSLSRTGSGGMLVPFLNADGAVASPGISWVNEPTSGLYRAAAGDMRFSVLGADVARINSDASNPLQVFVSAAFRPLLNNFSPYTIAGDWTWEGRIVTDDSTTVRAGFNIPLGIAPTVPVEGDMWKTATNAFMYVNGVAESIIGAGAPVSASTQLSSLLRGDGTGGWIEETAITVNASAAMKFVNGSLFLSDATGANGLQFFMTGTAVETIGISGGGLLIWGTDNRFTGKTFWVEKPLTTTPLAGQAEIWVLNSVSNVPMFTDDTDLDLRIMAAQTFNKIGDQQTVNNTSVLVAVTQMTDIKLDSGGIYLIEIQLRVNQANASANLKLALTPQGAGSFLEEDFRTTSISQLTNAFTFQDEQASTLLDATQNQTGNHLYQTVGIVQVGTGDLFDLEFAQVTPQVANTIIDDPSWMRVTRIG